MNIRRITWYVNRLASMSGAEIRHRVFEQIKRTISSRTTPEFSKSIRADVKLPVFPGLKDGLATLKNEEWLLHEWRKLAGKAKSGRVCLLGMEWPDVKKGGQWAIDPHTGKLWPQSTYCFQIPYRHTSDMGDVKYVWELNRLQYLQPIAALAAIESDQELASFCANEVESWIDCNPPFKGVNWASGIELSCRLVSMLAIISLIGEAAFTSVQRRKIQLTLAAHGYWLYRFPSRFSSANNHLIAEAGGLFLLGTLAPWLPESRKWVEYGKATLVREATKQIYDDGVGAEQSPTYLAFTLEWLLLCAHVSRQTGSSFPDLYWNRIESAGEYLRWITDSSGNQPRIGDDDEGRVFYSQDVPESYVTSVMGCVSTLTGRKELAPPKVKPHLREAMFGRTATGNDGPMGARCFPDGGYSLYRGSINGAEYMLAMDHGPLGYLSIAAHGHADALAIWLHISGHPVLVDSGTYLYHSGERWRDYMRSTPAHNTLSIGGASSSQLSGAFNWSSKAQTSLNYVETGPNSLRVLADHDGFMREFGVHHQRRLETASPKTISIFDMLTGKDANLRIEIGFLIHPELTLEGEESLWTVYDKCGGAILEIRSHKESLSGDIRCGLESPPRGWYSGAFGQKIPAPQLIFKGEMQTNQENLITLTLLS